MLVKITEIKVRTTSLQSMNWKRLLFFVFHEIGRYCWEKNTIPSHVQMWQMYIPTLGCQIDEYTRLLGTKETCRKKQTQRQTNVFTKRSIFQTFWKPDCVTRYLFFEFETSNFGYMLIFKFAELCKVSGRLDNIDIRHFIRVPPLNFQ